MAVQTKLQVRRDTAANWTSTNPTLAAGEIGFETDTLKFKIGNGSTAWNSLAYQNASTSAQNYAQTVGTKTNVLSSATTPYTIVSVSITTSGGPVLIMVSGDAENLSAGAWCRLQLYRGTTAIGNDIQLEGSSASENSGYALQFVDAQAAGTYTYNLKLTLIAGGNFNFGENTGPVITAIELNSLAGSANLASNIAGGSAGQLPYQNAANTTTFLTAPATNNSVLTYNTATSAPEWDSPARTMATIMGYTSTATAAGFTSLDNTSSYYQQFTGSTTQTVVMPNTATLLTGWTYHIVNNSTANVTANTFANAATLMVIPANTTAMVTCIDTTSNTATGWEVGLTDFGTYTGTGSVVMNNTPTFTTPNIGAATGTSVNVSGQLISRQATGTAPFVVSSTTQVANLNSATTSISANIGAGAAGSLPYQSAANTTTFLARTATNNSTLAFNSSTNAPFWVQSTLSNTYYAATTSAQLAGVISDETGSGNLVFGTTPTITPANAAAATAASTAGYIGMPQISVSANTAILATHAGKHIYTTVTGLTHTIPANSNVAFEIGTTLTFITPASVSLSIAVTTDTMYLAGTGTTGTRTLAAYGMATAVKITSTSWIISGNGLT